METMLEDFRYRGEWWNPANPDVRCRGEISFDSSDDIILTLEGTLASHSGGHVETEILVGRIDVSADRPVTLVHPLQWPSGYSSSGLETSIFRCRYMIFGKQFQSLTDIGAIAIWLKFTHLLEWLGNNSVLSTRREDNETRASFIRPEPIEGNIPCIETVFSISYELGERLRRFKSLELITSASIMLSPDDAHDLEWYLDLSYRIRHLLTLLIGRPIYFEEILMLRDIGESEQGPNRPEFLHLYLVQPDRHMKESISPIEMPVAFSEINNRLPEILNSWLGRDEGLSPLVDLYISNIFSRTFREFQFLSYIYCLEIYHRINFKGLYLDPEEFSEYSAKIQKSVSDILPKESKDLEDSLNQRLRYGNEYALRKRIREIFNELPEDLFTYLGISIGTFIRQIVDTRNYLTHYSTDLEAAALTSHRLSSATEKLRGLILALLLKDLGLGPEEVTTAVSRDLIIKAIVGEESHGDI